MAFCCEDCINWEYDNSLAGGHCGIGSCACADDITHHRYPPYSDKMPRRYIDKNNLPDYDKDWLKEETNV